MVVIRFFRAACHCVHHASYEWLLQRMTAVIMAVYSVTMVVLLLTQQAGGYEAWRSLFDMAWLKVVTLMFLFSLYIHAWQGVRDIIGDYIYPSLTSRALKVAVTVALLTYAVWSVQILWK